MIKGSDKQKFRETDKFKIEKPFPMNKVDVYQILANNIPEYSKLLILDTACQRNVTGDRWLSEQFSLSLSLSLSLRPLWGFVSNQVSPRM